MYIEWNKHSCHYSSKAAVKLIHSQVMRGNYGFIVETMPAPPRFSTQAAGHGSLWGTHARGRRSPAHRSQCNFCWRTYNYLTHIIFSFINLTKILKVVKFFQLMRCNIMLRICILLTTVRVQNRTCTIHSNTHLT